MKKQQIKRSQLEWQQLFEMQAESGLSQAQFCRENRLCPKHFGLRRKQLGFTAQPVSRFVKVTTPKQNKVTTSVKLRYQDLELVFDKVEPVQLIAIVKGLL